VITGFIDKRSTPTNDRRRQSAGCLTGVQADGIMWDAHRRVFGWIQQLARAAYQSMEIVRPAFQTVVESSRQMAHIVQLKPAVSVTGVLGTSQCFHSRLSTVRQFQQPQDYKHNIFVL